MPKLPKYNGTSDPNEHITTYTCAGKGNDPKYDQIEPVLLKRFGETLSKETIMWCHNLVPDPINSLTIPAGSSIKRHADAIEATTREPDTSRAEQRGNETPWEFTPYSLMERTRLPPVSDNLAIQAFTQSLNKPGPAISGQFKQNLIKYLAKTWSDARTQHQSQIRVVDDHPGASSGSTYPNRLLAKKPMPNRRRFDEDAWPTRVPRPSEYNFHIAIPNIVFAVGKTRDVEWLGPIRSNSSQRDNSMACKLHSKCGRGAEDSHQLRRKDDKTLDKNHYRELTSDRIQVQSPVWQAASRNKENRPQRIATTMENQRSFPRTCKRESTISRHQRKVDLGIYPKGCPYIQQRGYRGLVLTSQ
uniref:Uncharacterized protein n=1 Tax=Nicotiana tabacum TaxID=4097 RepID=A0A1S4BRW3_TOBAC|nr:PREDICTED: uncharacterized protein LOC107811257 [Nicotiana tabacum]